MRVVLGITGGIAAYKAAEIVSRLNKSGHEVKVIMTESAQAFITPLTLATLSGYPVVTEMFAPPAEHSVVHIDLARWAEVFLIAPATANVIGKIAHGIADDFLTTCVMATMAPVYFAPAMNDQMYHNAIFQRNMASLSELGYHFIRPVVGNLACGTSGEGKMAEPVDIVAEVTDQCPKDLLGMKILVTAGPTCERLDPVRYLTNRSSGKMGYAIAEVARCRGAQVTLVSGPVQLTAPRGVEVVPVTTAQEMFDALQAHFPTQDVVIKAAAPSDYRPATYQTEKIKKGDSGITVDFVRNPDILAALGATKQDQILVGFAAESHQLEAHAGEKLIRKNLDMIIANNITAPQSGFGIDENTVTCITKTSDPAAPLIEPLATMSKRALAYEILDRVLAIKKHRAQ